MKNTSVYLFTDVGFAAWTFETVELAEYLFILLKISIEVEMKIDDLCELSL